MNYSGSISNGTRLRTRLFLISLLCVFSLIAIVTIVFQRITTQDKNLQSDSKIHAKGKIASIVSTNHYKKPEFYEVYKHTNTIQEFNAYLKTIDPYSKYLTTKETIFYDKRNRKQRGGLGLDFLVAGEQILGVPVAPGPADKAGMILPAYVRSINDRKIDYSDFSSYSFLTKLPAGKVIRLSLEKNNNIDKTDYVVITANYINNPITYYTFTDTLLVRIKKFTAEENRQLKKKLQALDRYKKLVFDLRYSPGGDIYAMVDMLSFILPEDLTLVNLEKADGQGRLTLKTLPNRVVTGNPLYILVSKFTASSAELFTWAIKKNYPKAIVLGEPTKGKCLAQDTFRFADGSALRLSTYEVKNSFNQSCQGSPLVPDKLIRGIALSTTEDIFKFLTLNSKR